MAQFEGIVTEASEGQKYRETKNGGTATRVFFVENALSPFDAMFAEGIPIKGDPYEDKDFPFRTFFPRAQSVEVENMDTNDDLHKVTVEYLFERDDDTEEPSQPANGDEVYKYEPTTSSQRITQAIEQTRFGTVSHPPPKHLKAIGVTETEVEGVFVFDNTERLVVTQWLFPVNYTPAFQDAVRLVRNTKNSVIWYGAAIGECLFMGMREVSVNEDMVQIEFEFLISRNIAEGDLNDFEDVAGAPIPITGGKLGWDYLWAINATDEAASPDRTYQRGVYLSKVYPENDFSTLGLSGVQ